MKDSEYYKSGKHSENARKNCEKARLTHQRQKQDRINKYNQNPNHCLECNAVLMYNEKHKKFCCVSCSATYNNRKRIESGWSLSEESRKKTSEKLKGNPSPLKGKTGVDTPAKSIKIFLTECRICGKKTYVTYKHKKRTTCGSEDCKIQASVGIRTYQNGSRKPIWYYNKFEGKEVLLESSWEVQIAKLLDEKNIEWARPKFIKWVDSNSKIRRYFPDFYLPQIDVYLDPKNPYCMTKDKEKLEAVSKEVKLVFGSLEEIVKFIDDTF